MILTTVVFLALQVFLCSCIRENCEPDVTVNSSSSNQPSFLHFSCSSLDHTIIPSGIDYKATISIRLITQSSNLSSTVLLSNLFRVELRGQDAGWSEVVCSGDNSGLHFIKVQSVQLENLVLRGCGVKVQGSPLVVTHIHMAAILISNSAQVELTNLIFTNSKEFGVALYGVENSSISECRFEGQHSKSSASRGLLLQISQSYTSHIIQKCSFSENGVPDCSNSAKAHCGAGLSVLLQDNSSRNLLEISDCTFEQNFAQWGGAMYVELQGSSSNNSLILARSKFSNNMAAEGGGAAVVGVTTSSYEVNPTNNEVKITECLFERNTAFMGGSLHLFSSAIHCHSNTENKIQLKNSTWKENSAIYGAAIDARFHQYKRSKNDINFLLVDLDDDTFENNTVGSRWDKVQKGQSSGEGAIRIAEGIKLSVHKSLTMTRCTGSAIYLVSSFIMFVSGSKSTFQGNEGYRGGAIALIGEKSYIRINENCSIFFYNNTAKSIGGGAIYQLNSILCVIQQKGTKNMSLLAFKNNSAARYGHSIYVDSLQPCHTEENKNNLPISINYVNLIFKQAKANEVSTLGKKIATIPEKLQLAPGETAQLNITTRDETGSAIKDLYSTVLSRFTSAGNVSVINGNVPLTGRNNITFSGNPGQQGEVQLTSIYQSTLKHTLIVELSECPPGYIYQHDLDICICSANRKDRYIGIDYCNQLSFQASLHHSKWAGYISNSSKEHARGIGEFQTGFCPRGFCPSTNKTTTNVVLPSKVPSDQDLSAFVCCENREGILCARCIANHSVSFGDFRTCIPNKNCHLGFLYYTLSNLVPITVVFTAVLGFDISLTSGAVSGVIFYAQVLPNLLLTANDFLWFAPAAFKMLKGLTVITYIFSLRFFTSKSFAFCLWKGAGFLDVATFSFVSVIYALLLVVFTIKAVIPCVQRLMKCSKRSVSERQKSRHKRSKSIIHGLTSFLVICYSKSTTLSLYILAHATLFGKGGKPQKSRVFYNGELEYFKGKHLYYAIPAVFFLVIVTIVPPLLLLSYPLCYRVLALCRIQESRFTRLLCKAIPLEKYKPLFDSFQGSFKDEHRYFAGLEFTNRLAIAITTAYVRELSTYYVLLEAELIIMLVLIAYMQPHKMSWHNKINTFTLSTLLLLNTGTIWRYHQRKHTEFHSTLNFVDIGALQVSVAYFPFLYLLGYVVWQAAVAVKSWRQARVPVMADLEFVLSRMDQSSVSESNYVPLKDSLSNIEK